MHGPVVVGWLLALLCAATGCYCLTLGGRGPAPAPAAARTEAVMGLGMAAMALPGGGAVLPGGLFVALFGALAAWSGRSVWSARQARFPPHRAGGHRGHAGHGLHHMVEALAMAYMAVVMLGAEGNGGAHPGQHGAAGGVPVVTGGLLLYFAVFALYTGARLLPAAAATPPAGGACAVRQRGTAAACRLTLALGSFTMLLTL